MLGVRAARPPLYGLACTNKELKLVRSLISTSSAMVRAGQHLGFAGILALGVLAPAASALARGAPDGFADLAQRLSPAVVNVSTTETVSRQVGASPFPPGSPFDEFFKFLGVDKTK